MDAIKYMDFFNFFFLPQGLSNTGTGKQVRLDFTEPPALHGPILSERSNQMTSRAPFKTKLFYQPAILRVPQLEVMSSISFFLQLCNMKLSFLFCKLQFKFSSHFLQGALEAPTQSVSGH